MAEQSRLTPEMLVPRMGEYLIQKGLISTENLQKALDHQQEATAQAVEVLPWLSVGQGLRLLAQSPLGLRHSQ